jgi:hypothetical protein
MSDLFIKPAPGIIVRDPVTREPLAAEGESKPRNPHWLRRLKDGDVVEAKPETTTGSKKERGEK